MTHPMCGAALALLLVAVPAHAQDSGELSVAELIQAFRLPAATREARQLGVPERDLLDIFRTARERRVSAGSLADLFFEENDAVRKHGPIDNFGAFVQDKLRQGLRGRELAAAIHAEHARRGMGKGTKHAGDGPGNSDRAGKPGHAGKPDNAGKPDDAGKPGSPGKSGEKKGGPK